MHRFNPALGLLALLCAGAAQAQGTAQNDLANHRHLDFAGKPCLASGSVSHPLASNPRIFNHAVSLDNHCVTAIKVKVCYYRTDECTAVQVPAHGRVEQIIGVFPAMEQFRYEVKEIF
jgi:hypothetical protein